MEEFDRKELRPGDVMLHHGGSLVAKLIRLFDGTDVNHASLYLGDQWVGEAIGKGLVKRRLPESIDNHDWVLACRHKEAGRELDPVIDKANEYLDRGERYAYEQLLLLAGLSLFRKLKVTFILRRLLRKILDKACSVLVRLTSGGREPMICSEFVYRSYDDALPEPDDLYSIRIGVLPEFAFFRSDAPFGFTLPSGTAYRTIRGQGIHPESVFALLGTPASRSWIEGVAEPITLVDDGGEAEDAELDALIEQYLEEVKQVEKPVMLPDVTLEELRGAVNRYALGWLQASDRAPQLGISTRGEGAFMSTAYNHLFSTTAHFVTPGDLYKSQSLQHMGKIGS